MDEQLHGQRRGLSMRQPKAFADLLTDSQIGHTDLREAHAALLQPRSHLILVSVDVHRCLLLRS